MDSGNVVELPTKPPVELKNLSPKHKEAMALIAQGVGRSTVAEATGFVPEYITWLCRQEVCKEYLRGISEFADAQLLAVADMRNQAIVDGLSQHSTMEERLKAARLQLEATGRIGSRQSDPPPAPRDDRLVELSHRLVDLLHQQRRSSEKEIVILDSGEAGLRTG